MYETNFHSDAIMLAGGDSDRQTRSSPCVCVQWGTPDLGQTNSAGQVRRQVIKMTMTVMMMYDLDGLWRKGSQLLSGEFMEGLIGISRLTVIIITVDGTVLSVYCFAVGFISRSRNNIKFLCSI